MRGNFLKTYEFSHEAVDDGKTIFVAGLDGQYLRRSFGCPNYSPCRLAAQCELYGKRAYLT
uniref:Uncharacterized protein n=1 Tax=Rhizophora mucronata TaxID=61149 RepID=A0A2P2NNF2_RHIMU